MLPRTSPLANSTKGPRPTASASASARVLTRLVARIEAAGLLRREPDPADKRGLYASLTNEGLQALRITWPAYARAIAEHFGRYLTDEEVEVLDRALCRVLTAGRER